MHTCKPVDMNGVPLMESQLECCPCYAPRVMFTSFTSAASRSFPTPCLTQAGSGASGPGLSSASAPATSVALVKVLKH